jgi:hypothetical protein
VLLGLALRRNPRRAQLLVSRVLGKHVPTDPRLVRGAALLLGALVADVLAGRPVRAVPVDLLLAAVRGEPGAAAALPAHREPLDALVLGYAETATAWGTGSPRRWWPTTCTPPAASCPGPPRRAASPRSTRTPPTTCSCRATPPCCAPTAPRARRRRALHRRTALNTITALHGVAPRSGTSSRRWWTPGRTTRWRAGVAALGARAWTSWALSGRRWTVPPDVHARAAALLAALPEGHLPATSLREGGLPATAAVERVDLAAGWPPGLPAGGRHGFAAADHARLDAALPPWPRGWASGPGSGRWCWAPRS